MATKVSGAKPNDKKSKAPVPAAKASDEVQSCDLVVKAGVDGEAKKASMSAQREASTSKRGKKEVKQKTEKPENRPKQVSKIECDFELSRNEAAAYLEALAGGLRDGSIAIRRNNRDLNLSPAPNLSVQVAGKSTTRRGRLSLEIKWKRRDEDGAGASLQ